MSKTFRHFPNLKVTVNAFAEVITDHKVEEYKDKLQGLLKEFQARFDDLQELKLCFTFLVNPFDIDVINDGCLVRQPFVTDVSAAEMELTELQEDLARKILISATLQWSSGNRLGSVNIQNLKRPMHNCFLFLAQHIAVNLYSL